MGTIRNDSKSLDPYLKMLFFVLSSICGIFFWLSSYWWTRNPFWSSYSSNISVTSFGFLVAIFLIDHIIKKKEKKQWQLAEFFVKEKLILFIKEFSWIIVNFSCYDITRILCTNDEKKNLIDFTNELLKGLKFHFQTKFSVKPEKFEMLKKAVPYYIADIKGMLHYLNMLPDNAKILGFILALESEFSALEVFLMIDYKGNADVAIVEQFIMSDNSQLKQRLLSIVQLFGDLIEELKD